MSDWNFLCLSHNFSFDLISTLMMFYMLRFFFHIQYILTVHINTYINIYNFWPLWQHNTFVLLSICCPSNMCASHLQHLARCIFGAIYLDGVCNWITDIFLRIICGLVYRCQHLYIYWKILFKLTEILINFILVKHLYSITNDSNMIFHIHLLIFF